MSLAGALAAGAWLAWKLLGEVLGEALGYFLRPVTRPIWRIIVQARSPWPLAVMLLTGIAASVAGVRLMRHDNWRGGAGLLLFLGGAGFAMLSPFLWRDAKAEAARTDGLSSRPVV